MDRTEFLNIMWQKILKPILIIFVIIFCLKLIQSYSGWVFSFIVIFVGLEVIQLIISFFKQKISLKIKTKIIIFVKYLNILSILILPFIIFFSWQKDAFGTILLLFVILLSKLIKLEKLNIEPTTKLNNLT